jgi:WD40 repeat protein
VWDYESEQIVFQKHFFLTFQHVLFLNQDELVCAGATQMIFNMVTKKPKPLPRSVINHSNDYILKIILIRHNILVAITSNTILIWNTDDAQLINHCQYHPKYLEPVNSTTFATTSDNAVAIWNIKLEQVKKVTFDQLEFSRGSCISLMNPSEILISIDGYLRVWNFDLGTVRHITKERSTNLLVIAVGDRYMATQPLLDNQIVIRDLKFGQMVYKIDNVPLQDFHGTFQNNLLYQGANRDIFLFDVHTRQILKTFRVGKEVHSISIL